MEFISRSNRGFAPLVVIAIIAVVAVGGGAAYVISQNKADVAMEGSDMTASMEGSAETSTGAEVSAGIDARGTLRSLLGLGQNVMCTFTSTAGAESSGTVYVANGSMRTDFRAEAAGSVQTGSMIVKDDTSYVWMGSQGMKMDLSAQAEANANANAEQSVDLDAPVEYDCETWTPDASKFTLPAGVEFVDIQAMMEGAMKGVDVKAMMKGTIQ